MFIVLTGENWNEIMILTIDTYGKFMGPACLFIAMMMIGNFMLLNLFLAILLKSISNLSNDAHNKDTHGNEGSKTEV
jgi:hypothetical protein